MCFSTNKGDTLVPVQYVIIISVSVVFDWDLPVCDVLYFLISVDSSLNNDNISSMSI